MSTLARIGARRERGHSMTQGDRIKMTLQDDPPDSGTTLAVVFVPTHIT
ncbi:MAG: hypothetical protein SGJ24_06175 [Chloroflexota bacterium]|nr:hypothetical protein [Chloroflexota bacterium]